MFKKARQLMKENDFLGGVHYLRLCYFSDGLRLGFEENEKMKKWRKKAAEAGLRVDRLDLDVWTEFLTCDNVIVFWRKAEKNRFAMPVVLDCESCAYSDALGVESLKVRPQKCKLSDAQKFALGPRWSVALEAGKLIELDPAQGEHFKVLTWGKRGGGLGWPRLGQILDKLGLRELLEIADMGGAWESGDIYRQIKKGHAITSGDHAGDSTHFITAAQSEKIKKDNAGKRGPRVAVTNFDVNIEWKTFDPKFFDEKKYAAVAAKLRAWAGAPGMMYESGVSPMMMTAFATEGRKWRSMVGTFLTEILSDPTFNGGVKPPDDLAVSWNPQSFLDTKMMLEWVRAGSSTGLISPQTARNALGVNNNEEGRLLKEAHADPESYRPVFEAKQGMLTGDGKGGRPSDRPGAQTPPTDPVLPGE